MNEDYWLLIIIIIIFFFILISYSSKKLDFVAISLLCCFVSYSLLYFKSFLSIKGYVSDSYIRAVHGNTLYIWTFLSTSYMGKSLLIAILEEIRYGKNFLNFTVIFSKFKYIIRKKKKNNYLLDFFKKFPQFFTYSIGSTVFRDSR